MEQPIDPIGIDPLGGSTTYNHLVVRYAARSSSASYEASKVGFSPCAPFGEYVGSPTGACMTIEIEPAAPARGNRR